MKIQLAVSLLLQAAQSRCDVHGAKVDADHWEGKETNPTTHKHNVMPSQRSI